MSIDNAAGSAQPSYSPADMAKIIARNARLAPARRSVLRPAIDHRSFLQLLDQPCRVEGGDCKLHVLERPSRNCDFYIQGRRTFPGKVAAEDAPLEVFAYAFDAIEARKYLFWLRGCLCRCDLTIETKLDLFPRSV